MKHLFAVLLSALLLAASTVHAEEGMWLLDQLEALEWQSLEKKGMALSPDEVRELRHAIVYISTGSSSGSGGIVSPMGLILTNHHVANAAIQRVSTPEANYLENGFLADGTAGELPVNGYLARIVREMDDVTGRVYAGVEDGMDESVRDSIVTANADAIEGEDAGAGRDVSVVSLFSGMKYYRVVTETYRDVRLVYAPPSSIGNYGGDIDNWMWPRHTGDFTFLRIYTAPDGSPAEYSADNVPMRTDRFMRMSDGDLDAGDFTFIMGFPGSTFRYRTSNSVGFHQEVRHPWLIEMYGELIELGEAAIAADPDNAIKLADVLASLNNTRKNSQGSLEGFRKLGLLEKKLAMEAEFMEWVDSDPETKERYGSILSDIAAEYDSLDTIDAQRRWMTMLSFVDLPGVVKDALLYARDKAKPEDERSPAWSEARMKRRMQQLEIQGQQWVPLMDRMVLKAAFNRLADMPEGQAVPFVAAVVGDRTGAERVAAIDAWVDRLFDKSAIQTFDDAVALFEKSLDELEDMDDPMIRFAADWDAVNAPNARKLGAFGQAVTRLRGEYARALFAWKGENLYPDANSTLRFTWGTIEGYQPADAVTYAPQTTLGGTVAKYSGSDPFDMPEKLRRLYAESDVEGYVDPELGDVPVNFTHTTDITGGNSGSPVMNGKGEVIGVAFDGNYESITADYQFELRLNRTISVDSRYILFIVDKLAGSKRLMEELRTPVPQM